MKFSIIENPPIDTTWDRFLEGAYNGHHVQSSAWGQLKSKFGMKVIRVIVKEDNSIIGGAQILIRPLPLYGNIGYISRGPVVVKGRSDVIAPLFDKIEQVANDQNLFILSIEPPSNEDFYMNQLSGRDFKVSSFYIIPPTTVLVDLHQNKDEILAQMRKNTRYGVRYAQREDVKLEIRDGSEEDLSLLFSWMKSAAKRDPYYYYSLEYFQEARRLFEPQGNLKLFMAYHEGQPISGIIVIAFGSWAAYKWAASSGEHRNTKPNELLNWHAILWSQEKGCDYYDLGGITPLVADALNAGVKPPKIKGAGIAHFKLGFGKLYNFPVAYDNNYGPFPRWMIRKPIELIWKMSFLRDFIRKLINPGT